MGAWLELDASRQVDFWGFVPWWFFFALGGLLVVLIPLLVARGIPWLSLLFAVLVSGKALYLLWGQGRRIAAGAEAGLYEWFFAAVAGLAALALWRSFLVARRAGRGPG